MASLVAVIARGDAELPGLEEIFASTGHRHDCEPVLVRGEGFARTAAEEAWQARSDLFEDFDHGRGAVGHVTCCRPRATHEGTWIRAA